MGTSLHLFMRLLSHFLSPSLGAHVGGGCHSRLFTAVSLAPSTGPARSRCTVMLTE